MTARQDAEMPRIASAAYASTTSNMGAWQPAIGSAPIQSIGHFDWNPAAIFGRRQDHFDIDQAKSARELQELIEAQFGARQRVKPNQPKKESKMAEVKTQRRIVQVFIMDPDENVPLTKALLYQGAQKVTDLTDQELFFEISVKDALDTHNAYRATLTDKSVKSKTVHLEPIRIRDLRMTVVTIASF